MFKYPLLYVGGALLLALFVTSVGAAIITAPAFKIGLRPVLTKQEAKEVITVPERITNLIQSGLKAYKKGYFDMAEIDLETAKFLSPSPLPNEPLWALVDCYIITGNYQRSIGLLEELIAMNPENPILYTKLGLSHLLDGKYLEAIDSLDSALELDENERSAMLYLGLAYKQMGVPTKTDELFQKAVDQYKQILLINEDDLPALIELSTIYIYWEREQNITRDLLSKAKEIAQKSDSDYTTQIILKFYIPMLEGLLNNQTGKYHESLINLTVALQNAPQGLHSDLARIYYYIGKNYIQLQELDQTKKFYARALEIAPEYFYTKEMKNFLEKE